MLKFRDCLYLTVTVRDCCALSRSSVKWVRKVYGWAWPGSLTWAFSGNTRGFAAPQLCICIRCAPRSTCWDRRVLLCSQPLPWAFLKQAEVVQGAPAGSTTSHGKPVLRDQYGAGRGVETAKGNSPWGRGTCRMVAEGAGDLAPSGQTA